MSVWSHRLAGAVALTCGMIHYYEVSIMMISESLEKCESCGNVVRVEDQYLGKCHKCIERLHLTSCEACGSLYTLKDAAGDSYLCPACV